ncbi:MAG: sulfite exporter TauE/SafE family protein [Acidimicrobiia bacterium]
MSLWAVFLAGLFAGGASCAAVQGGLLAAVVSRRRQPEPALAGPGGTGPALSGGGGVDAAPVLGFLAGKLLSHVALGAALGGLGSALQLSFRTRSTLQITAGLVMLVLAADLLGVPGVRRLVPRPPPAWGRLVRRSGRFSGALGPGVLGFATVLIPCGATLAMEFLAVASDSPASGAAVMAAFVIGTTPLFAVLGYAARRSATVWRGRLAMLAGVAVIVAGLVSVNAGLVLRGSSVTASSAWSSLTGDDGGGAAAPAAPAADGTQRIVIIARSEGYSPTRLSARAGVPTTLVMRSEGADGCMSAVVFPSLGVERNLPRKGDTVIEVAALSPGKHRFTCSMGMYSGVIAATA